jgi:acetyltransferase-like isoleucine patch superfamily enzyme
VTHPDLVTLERAAAVNRGCVLSTQTAHGSTVQLDSVVLEEGSTLGPNTVALPAARVGAGATVGPGSLVLRGDEVPAHTRWLGNPIAPWPSVRRRDASAAKPAAKPVREPAA